MKVIENKIDSTIRVGQRYRFSPAAGGTPFTILNINNITEIIGYKHDSGIVNHMSLDRFNKYLGIKRIKRLK